MNQQSFSYSFFSQSVRKAVPALLVLLIFCSSCENNEKEVAAFGKKSTPPEEGKDLVIYMSEAAKVKGKLTSPYMLRYQADTPSMVFPKTLHVDFYNDSMKTESYLDAKYGKYYQSLNKVYLRDSVVVKKITTGDTLHCRDLWWDQRTGNFTTDDSVEIYSKDKITFGKGMTADQNFRYYTILHMRGSILSTESGLPK